MKRRIWLLVPLMSLALAQADFPSESEVRRMIDDFMRGYNPGAPAGYTAPSSPPQCGADLLSLAIQAYNVARTFFRGLPNIYLRGVSDQNAIRNAILGRGTYEMTIVTGKTARLSSFLVQALRERVFIPDRTYPQLTLYWSMPKDELDPYLEWKKANPPPRATLNLTGRGEDVLMDTLGVPESLGFAFMMLNNKVYLFNCVFFEVDPGPAGAFIPWIRLVQSQIMQSQGR